ncbi:hypothetical protein EON68_04960 [archaeon]|nr:MAG: hypothetical protein EON68_04960 [archaeon]
MHARTLVRPPSPGVQIIREEESGGDIFLVFERLDMNLYELMRSRFEHIAKPLPLPTIRSIMHQLCQALAYMHSRGFFHR